MIFFGLLLLLGAAAAVAFVLPLGPALAAPAIGLGASLAMLLMIRLAGFACPGVAEETAGG